MKTVIKKVIFCLAMIMLTLIYVPFWLCDLIGSGGNYLCSSVEIWLKYKLLKEK